MLNRRSRYRRKIFLFVDGDLIGANEQAAEVKNFLSKQGKTPNVNLTMPHARRICD
ncbi:MAG: hypothetical protein WCI56_12355 [Hyphomicrobiales bacterium]